jgi:adenine-specific DNA-methyltransferase
MARIHELLAQLHASAPALAADIQREVDVLADRRAFGLNFERHTPEAVELPGRKVRVGDKVRIQPPRGETQKVANRALYRVAAFDSHGDQRVAVIAALGAEFEGAEEGDDTQTVNVDDLVVVAEFRDPIYPGLVSTGRVERGDDKPYHAVINAENFHALQTLLFTHRGRVDAIYIDPPYNSGARDWKYNNDYVEGDDMYRHSKWLAFMERRLQVAKELLNPVDSVLIVTIDEKEYLRLGLLLEQTFPEARIQMVAAQIAPQGNPRNQQFYRTDEYVFFLGFGAASPAALALDDSWRSGTGDGPTKNINWASLLRTGSERKREDRPSMFYPIFVQQTEEGARIHSFGEPFYGADFSQLEPPAGTEAVWPIGRDGEVRRWQVSADSAERLRSEGFLRAGRWNADRTAIQYLARTNREEILSGAIATDGRNWDGSFAVSEGHKPTFIPGTLWKVPSHDATRFGTQLLPKFLPGRKFPFPKSLYAVEDALRFFLRDRLDATVLDFFAGSGTTAHAVMRLNHLDGGRRQSISVTNNEVSANEQGSLRARGLRPGDPEWDEWGICDYITKPRIRAAITGLTPEGQPVEGSYRFTDEFLISDGFDENVEFFTLTYEAPMRVQSNREFGRIAPFLWLRAGSRGRRIESLEHGWDVADAYGVIADLDQTDAFLEAITAKASAHVAFIVTDEDRLFQAVVRDLPPNVEPVRMYEAYLRNFEIDAMRSVR